MSPFFGPPDHNELNNAKKIPISNVCLVGWKKISSLQVSFRDPPLEKISKNVDSSLGGKPCITLAKWTFSRVLAHYAHAAQTLII